CWKTSLKIQSSSV
ncbi:putative tetrathionate reductase, subunit A domain protein, partial [Vibrio parahaemolyticus V-223/04]